jgi:hypothetical protein
LVTFIYQSDADRTLYQYTRRLKRCCYPCLYQPHPYQGRHLRARQAREPSDLIWEHLPYGRISKFLRKTITTLMTLLMLAVNFIVMYEVEQFRSDLQANNSNLLPVIALVVGVFTGIFTLIIQMAISAMASFERHSSRSAEEHSIAGTKFWSHFVYSVLIIGYVFRWPSPDTTKWYTDGGLLILSIMLSDWVITIIVKACHPFTRIRQCCGRCQAINQTQLNTAMLGPQWQLWSSYSSILVTLFIGFMYTCPIPVLTLICTMKLTLLYYIEKYNLLRM